MFLPETSSVTVDQNFFSAGLLFNVMETINSILGSNVGNKYLGRASLLNKQKIVKFKSIEQYSLH